MSRRHHLSLIRQRMIPGAKCVVRSGRSRSASAGAVGCADIIILRLLAPDCFFAILAPRHQGEGRVILMSTKAQRKAERRKSVSSGERKLETVIDPVLFKALEQLITQGMHLTNNDQRFRDRVIALSSAVRKRAVDIHGFITADSEMLSGLLRATDSKQRDGRRFGELDVMEYIDKTLDLELAGWAHNVQSIWLSFSKFLSVSAIDYEPKARNTRAAAPQPLDVMHDDIWEAYKEWFTPWLTQASRRRTPTKYHRGTVQNSEIIHHILVLEQLPEMVDAAFGLKAGTALAVLIAEMKELAGPPVKSSEAGEGIRVYIAPEAPPPPT